MAEVNTGGGGGGRHGGGKPKPKKMSTKIDMTPMVDLAFLLLTFFMLTTTFSKPKTMEITIPEDDEQTEDPPKMQEDGVLSVLLLPENKILWFTGQTNPAPQQTNYSKDGIRKLLFEKKRQIAADKFMVLIKPHKDSKYKNLVDMYDEMNVTGIKRYAQVEMSPEEQKMADEALAAN